MSKYTIDIEFTPTLANAPELLMDIAALLSQPLPEQAVPEADHSRCVDVADYETLATEAQALRARIPELESQLRQVTAERDQLIKNAEKLAGAQAPKETNPNRTGWKLPRVGEMVKLVPHPGHEGWTTGVVKAIHGKGGTKGIEVMPKGHGRTEIIASKYLKRFAENERAEMAA